MHEIVGLLYSVHVLGRHFFFSLLRTHASVWPFLFSLMYTSAYSSYLLHYTRNQLCEQVSPQHLLYCRVFQILIKKIHSWSMHGSIVPCHHTLWTHLLNRLARLLHSLPFLRFVVCCCFSVWIILSRTKKLGNHNLKFVVLGPVLQSREAL